jgi:cobalt-zinc-cadmium efflux system protein
MVSAPLPRLRVVLVLTAVFMLVEAVGGWLSGSLALLADAGHMLTDVGALALCWSPPGSRSGRPPRTRPSAISGGRSSRRW